MLRSVLMASRPVSWINTAFPFAAGYLMLTREIDAFFVVGTLFFLIPYNLLMYGINDIFDYESDLANPRKGGIEGGLVERSEAARTHRAILVSAIVATVVPMAWLLWAGSLWAGVTLVLVVAGVVLYSAPGARYKERPVLDSFTSAMHFVGPLVYALVVAGDGGASRDAWVIVIAFVLWGMASHAFGAVQDVVADRAAGIHSVATFIGARATVWGATGAYVASAATLLAGTLPVMLASVLPLAFAANTSRFLRVTDATCERANRGWKTFLWLNQPVGFVVTMLLIAVWRGWL